MFYVSDGRMEIDDDIEPPCDKPNAIVEFDGAINGVMLLIHQKCY